MDHRSDLGLEDDWDASRGRAPQLAAGRSSSMPRNQSSPAEEGEEDLRVRRRSAHGGVRSARSSPVSQRRLWPPPSSADAISARCARPLTARRGPSRCRGGAGGGGAPGEGRSCGEGEGTWDPLRGRELGKERVGVPWRGREPRKERGATPGWGGEERGAVRD